MNENYRIVVDAGHGGDDPGAISGNLLEKDLNFEAANYMYNRFKELGVPVVITRDTDKTLSRAERINLMKSLGTDPNVIILSNHINAGGGVFPYGWWAKTIDIYTIIDKNLFIKY